MIFFRVNSEFAGTNKQRIISSVRSLRCGLLLGVRGANVKSYQS